eukprot:TRINITY_DN8397_c0_g1_i1.p1 TRINITY_DN8397_c0_g1~~TRINITY_DN8397_c0_g1_i1.p1  ORF type:complete len:52 (-),score=11.68 TRINITY_DN8397_c0_g1_i1:63-218(-)
MCIVFSCRGNKTVALVLEHKFDLFGVVWDGGMISLKDGGMISLEDGRKFNY